MIPGVAPRLPCWRGLASTRGRPDRVIRLWVEPFAQTRRSGEVSQAATNVCNPPAGGLQSAQLRDTQPDRLRLLNVDSGCLAMSGSRGAQRRHCISVAVEAGPAPIVFQLGLVARPCPRHGPQSLADGLVACPTRPAVAWRLKPIRRLAPPDDPPDAGASRPIARRFASATRDSTSAGRSGSARRLRQGRQGDTVEAIAPDAATLRSRHVARRMGSTIIPLLRFVLGGSLDCFPTR
jgi:hypothetical protein